MYFVAPIRQAAASCIKPLASYIIHLSTNEKRRYVMTSGLRLYRRIYCRKFIEDIYFFEVNTKYISSSAVKNISIFNECVARVKMLIFSPHEMKYIWYLPRKSKFSFYFILNGNAKITTLPFTWSFLVRFGFCSVFIGYNIGCKHSLHLENTLDSYFNE